VGELYGFRAGTEVKKAQSSLRADERGDYPATNRALAAGTQQLLAAVERTRRASVRLTAQEQRALAELIAALAELLGELPENM
jgi:hypothetical protein